MEKVYNIEDNLEVNGPLVKLVYRAKANPENGTEILQRLRVSDGGF